MASTLAVVWLIAACAQTRADGDAPRRAQVVPFYGVVSERRVEVMAAPEARAFAVDRLEPGSRVRVVEIVDGNWWAVEPVSDRGVCWVPAARLVWIHGKMGRVGKDGVEVRAGRLGARLPGPVCARAVAGSAVRFLDLPPLELASPSGITVWRAIAPPEGVRWYIAAWSATPAESLPSRAKNESMLLPGAVDAALSMTSFVPGEGAVRVEVESELARLAALERAMVRKPIDEWDFRPILNALDNLIATTSDAKAQALLKPRRARVAARLEAEEASRSIERVIERGRRRDRELAALLRDEELGPRPTARPFLARGLVQPSSREINGERVYALIGDDGKTVAYLKIPPGLEVGPQMSKRVGVRGKLSYDEDLRARLIAVEDLIPLDRR